MNSFQDWLRKEDVKVVEQRALGGGCTADAQRIRLDTGQLLFVKQQSDPEVGQFLAEAIGLDALRRSGAVRTPKVIAVGDRFLLLEYVDSAPRSSTFEEQLAQSLATQHTQTSTQFGFSSDTFCGPTIQPNDQGADGYQFYSEHRFLYLAQRCVRQQALDRVAMDKIEVICNRLPQLVPIQPPALLHGDLWAGNVITDTEGDPLLIDPAVYYGWPEADLGMTKLFGGFSDRFYQIYNECRPLEAGWEERMDLYNLWHLLNHLLLFGNSYLREVERVIEKYV